VERAVRRSRGRELNVWGRLCGGFLPRLGEALFTLWLVASVLFVLVHLAPGDPAAALGGDTQSAQTRAADLARFGLDTTLTDRYLGWLMALTRGDLGQSFMFRAPVSAIIGERLPVTLALTLPTLALSSLIGILLALWASLRPGAAFDRITQGAILLVFALPVYWVGHLLIQWFALDLRWFPVQGLADLRNPATGGAALLGERIRHLTLPIAALVTQQLALVWLVTRAGLDEARAQPHFRTALAKGLSTGAALRRHALPQTGLALATVIGARTGALLTSATLVETVFGLPGMGRLMVSASLARDYPLVLGILLVAVALTLLANALTDLVYRLLDPRIARTS